MLVGYARVSSGDQNFDLQVDALKVAEQIHLDQLSGAAKTRPGLDEAFKHLRAGDTWVVWKLGRLDRTVKG